MEKKDVWGKIKKTVAEGVAVAAEKTEELRKLGKAKIDILAIRRNITKKRTELGAVVYTAAKEGKTQTVFSTPVVKGLVGELDNLDNELAKKQEVYEALKRKAGSDMAAMRKKAETRVKSITKKAKTKVGAIRKKARAKTSVKGKTGTKTA